MPKMPIRKLLSLLCLAASSLFLLIGYPQFGPEVGLLTFLAWLAARHWPGTWTAGLALVVSTLAAVLGLVAGSAFAWMLLSLTLSLASWDLILLDRSLAGQPLTPQVDRLEKLHYPSLGLALGAGLLAVLAGRTIHLQIPFFVMLALVALLYLSLERLFRALKI